MHVESYHDGKTSIEIGIIISLRQMTA